jgi:glutamate synthase (ferredoxin)
VLALGILGGLLVLLGLIALRDRLQRTHAVIANFPIIGHFRYWLEAVGGPLRQYIVTARSRPPIAPRTS